MNTIKHETGSIRKIKDGYGFIAGDTGVDFFFHWSGLSKFTKQIRALKEGERCEFDVFVSERGPRAINIQIIGSTLQKDSPDIPELNEPRTYANAEVYSGS